ncbi:MAG: serine acetyltransferase [Prevotella sp.]|nr:serine acetyltransferase [Prevotella sp.]
MTFKEFRNLYRSDLFRYFGGGRFFYTYFTVPGFKYTFNLRLYQYAASSKIFFPIKAIVLLNLKHIEHRYGIMISRHAQIGKGFYIGHYGTIVVSSKAVIGCNVNISHGVTIGVSNRGNNAGVPTIGDYVYIGPGAKIIGNIHVGNHAAIGANAVVTKDVPDNACVGGVPAKILNMEGSAGYVNRTV